MQYELTFIAKKTGVEEERPIFANSDLMAVQAAATKIGLMGDLGSNFKLTAPDGREIALPCIGRSRGCGQALGRVMGDKISEDVNNALVTAAAQPMSQLTAGWRTRLNSNHQWEWTENKTTAYIRHDSGHSVEGWAVEGETFDERAIAVCRGRGRPVKKGERKNFAQNSQS